MTATIVSIVQNGLKLIVNVSFTDIGMRAYAFSILDTPTSIQSAIQSDLDNMNGLTYQLGNVQALVGTTLQTSPTTLTALQGTIQSQNTAAAKGS